MINDIDGFISTLERERMRARISEPVSPDLEADAMWERIRKGWKS